MHTTINNTDIAITILQKPIGYKIQRSVFGISLFFSRRTDAKYKGSACVLICFTSSCLFSLGDLYVEGVFRVKSCFLNAPGLIHGGAYYWNFTVSNGFCNNVMNDC